MKARCRFGETNLHWMKGERGRRAATENQLLINIGDCREIAR